jgi:pimeloyl-ACP methyl ester carboxylesterase
MSSSGSLRLPGPRWDLRLMLLRRPAKMDRAARIERMAEILGRIGSPVHPTDQDELRARAARELDRCDYPPGYLRQLAAITGSPSRLPLLPRIAAPTLVIHGDRDPLVPVAAAHDLARRIPGADLEIVPGMGHDLPAILLPGIIDRILGHLRRA